MRFPLSAIDPDGLSRAYPRTGQPARHHPAAERNSTQDVGSNLGGIVGLRCRRRPGAWNLRRAGQHRCRHQEIRAARMGNTAAFARIGVDARHLREVITAFIATGSGGHSAPYYRQGSGTINMLLLAMLSQIAEDKQNVIFAMEEPETAIPPYAQKNIIHELRKLSAQTLFTSHSPYVLEEFSLDETIVLGRSADGQLTQSKVVLPESVKLKRYRQQFRTRFCEGLLARRVLLAEG